MCVIAGYTGSESAAAVLIAILRREQGMGGGYYTGIATVHEGQLHCRKVLGDLDTLLERTDAASLPGTVGIAHSRSMGGGEDSWAHPFVDEQEQLAYVANGAVGYFSDRVDLAAAGNAALRRGEHFRTATREKIGSYPSLEDGSCVHLSEIMAHEIAWHMHNGPGLAQALALAYCAIPSELVGLCVHAGSSGSIAGCRLNMPMALGRDATGTFVATTALAFPSTVEWVVSVPANTTITMDRSGARLEDLPHPPATVLPLPSVPALNEAIAARLAGGEPRTLGELSRAARALWPENALAQPGMAVFHVLWGLHQEERLCWDEIRVPGQYGRGTVPQTRFHRVAKA